MGKLRLASRDEGVGSPLVSPLRFGTGGIRALMGPRVDQLNESTVAAVTQAVAAWVLSTAAEPVVALARDCRACGDAFVEVVVGVLAANGVRVILLPEPAPTPVLCHVVRERGCDAGVVITASHNAREWNGYKVYDARGCQATDAITNAIQGFLEQDAPVRRMDLDEALRQGVAERLDESVFGSYLCAVCDAVSRFAGVGGNGREGSLSSLADGVSVVYSPLNGTAGALASGLLRSVGADCVVVREQMEPDGTFPTCPLPNPEDVDALELGMRLCEQQGADLLLANDPDADRLGVGVLHEGRCVRLTGDEVALLLFDWVCRLRHECGEGLDGKVAYATVVTTPLADEVAARWGVELRRTLTGFKYIGEQVCLLEEDGELDRFLLGIEESCGYLVGPYVRDKDGISATVAVAAMAAWHKGRGMSLYEALVELYDTYGWCRSRQVSVETPMAEASPFGSLRQRCLACEGVLAHADSVRVGGMDVVSITDFAEGIAMPSSGPAGFVEGQSLPVANVLELVLDQGGRVLVRPSGTEPKTKAYVFARGGSKEEADGCLARLDREVRDLLARAGEAREGWAL